MKRGKDGKSDASSLQMTIVVDGPDSDIATMIEAVLEEELSDFFFGCEVRVETKDQDDAYRKLPSLPRACKAPLIVLDDSIEVFESSFDDPEASIQQDIAIKVYRRHRKKAKLPELPANPHQDRLPIRLPVRDL